MGSDAGVTDVIIHTDEAGREFGYVPVHHDGSRGLGIHFSAFFGAWGNARVYRDAFQGYFHRKKMLGSCPDHDWLFLCDPFGVNDNGCYYLGQGGDLFVDRAMSSIVDRQLDASGHAANEVVTIGSSMGATAALYYGLRLGVAGIIAIGPHVDLDISARMQNRMAEVAWTCPDGDPLAAHNHHLTRRINGVLDHWPDGRQLPRLFLQSCADDVGVYAEQVLPLVDRWRGLGGSVAFDSRPEGGHTSDFATRGVLLDATWRLLAAEPIDVERYQTDPELMGAITRDPLAHRVRRSLSLARKRVLRRSDA